MREGDWVTKSPVEESLPEPGIHGLKGDKLCHRKIHELLRHCLSDTETGLLIPLLKPFSALPLTTWTEQTQMGWEGVGRASRGGRAL